MGIESLFEPSNIRRLSKDETMALYKRHMMAQYERAESAEAEARTNFFNMEAERQGREHFENEANSLRIEVQRLREGLQHIAIGKTPEEQSITDPRAYAQAWLDRNERLHAHRNETSIEVK